MLTHFSPRYQKIAEITDLHKQERVMVAFDHLRVKIKDLEHTCKLLDVYASVLSNDD